MSFYIKGNKERGAEVIKLLEDAGGINVANHKGDIEAVYYINNKGFISFSANHFFIRGIQAVCYELTLPEKKEWKPKFKVGDRVYTKQDEHGVIAYVLEDSKAYVVKLDSGYAFKYMETLLTLEEWTPKFKVGDYVTYKNEHFIGQVIDIGDKYCHILDENNKLVSVANNYDIVPWTPRRGETVLVRDFKDDKWDEGIFSYYDNDEDKFVLRGGVMYEYCIPFDESKLGKITDE